MTTPLIYIVPSAWERAHTLEGDGALVRVELLAQLDEARAVLLAIESERGVMDAEFERLDNLGFFDLLAEDVGVGAGLRACNASLLEESAHAEIDEAAWHEASAFALATVRQDPDPTPSKSVLEDTFQPAPIVSVEEKSLVDSDPHRSQESDNV